MNHAQLRAFNAVAQEGGFTAAARTLGLTQPAVTVQVKALEDLYQVELFHRRGREVTPTRVGQELYGMTRRMLLMEREAEEFLQAEGGLRRGQIRIAADGPFHILPMIKRIREALPKMDVSVSIGNSETVTRGLLDYQAEIGVLGEYSADDRFAVLSAVRHPILLVMSVDHPFAGRTSVHISELDGMEMIKREQGSGTRRSFEAALAEAGAHPNYVLEIGSREAAREAVAEGLGLGVIQAPEVGQDARIVSAAIDGAEISTGEFVICLEERRRGHLMRRLAPAAAGD